MTARLCMVLLVVAFGGPPQTALQDVPALGSLDAWLAEEFAEDAVGGASIGVVVGNKLVWTGTYGYADMDGRRKPTVDTACRIGSVTKQFTALMLLQLVEDGKVRLTDRSKQARSRFGCWRGS